MSKKKRRIAVLGSTGSIGENALKIIRHLSSELELTGIAARNNCKRLAEQAKELGAKFAVVRDESKLEELKSMLPKGVHALAGLEGLIQLATNKNVDMVLCAIVGIEGIFPVLEAIKAKKDIAIASKEVLVLAGDIVMNEVRKNKVAFIPVDSEHSAVFQCIEGRKHSEIRKIILTASGGPFRGWKREKLSTVSFADALNHPTWDMGPKVTVDSATMMNKALEIIEAGHLFDLPAEKIEVVIHPQSVVHSMVEFLDGTILAQLSPPNMCYPIQNALTYPLRHHGIAEPLDFAKFATLTFEKPDIETFPSIKFAYQALKKGGTLPAVMNAANEIAFERFKKGEISFTQIWDIIENTMNVHEPLDAPKLNAILKADLWARSFASNLVL
ncbi:MAG: 1-deoxy-D-xylulose-5-phosphate reductoisomerase [Candidatus Nanoarchaeia archaeon]